MSFIELLNLAWKIIFPSATTRNPNARIAKQCFVGMAWIVKIGGLTLANKPSGAWFLTWRNARSCIKCYLVWIVKEDGKEKHWLNYIHTIRLCMNIIQPMFFLTVFFDNSYKIAFNATPCISSCKKSCNWWFVG